jgi:hypothetical protein
MGLQYGQQVSPPPASPSVGLDGRCKKAGPTPVRPSPRLPASPPPGVNGRSDRGHETRQQFSTLPAEPQLSCARPTWASIVRDGACARRPPQQSSPTLENIAKEDFVALYECCVRAGLKARVAIRHAAGPHEVTLSCYFSTKPPPNAPAARRRRRRRLRRDPVATDAATAPDAVGGNKSPPSARAKDYDSLATTHAAIDADTAPDYVCGDKPPPAARAETESDATTPAVPPSPPLISPPAKRTRKAAKRRCEVELLRDEELEGEIQLSPLSCATHTPSLSPPTPPTPPENDDLQLLLSSPTPTSPSALPMPSPTTSSPPSSPRLPAPPIDKSPTIPAAPPMSAYFPSCPFKVICRYCLQDDHDVRCTVSKLLQETRWY